MARGGKGPMHTTQMSSKDGKNLQVKTPLLKQQAAKKHSPHPLFGSNGIPKTSPAPAMKAASAAQHFSKEGGDVQHKHVLKRLNMGPSSEEDMDEGINVEESDSGSAGDEHVQHTKRGESQDQEAYKRALRRMEMGPSDDEESGGDGDMSDEGDLQGPGTLSGSGSGEEDDGLQGRGNNVHASGSVEEGDSESERGGGKGRLKGLHAKQQQQQQQQGKRGGGTQEQGSLMGLGYFDGSGVGQSGSGSDEGDESGPDEEGGSGVGIRRLDGGLPNQKQGLKGAAAGAAQKGGRGVDESGPDSGVSSEGEEDEEDEEIDEEAAFLAELPLEERLALRTDGSGPDGSAARAAAAKARVVERSFKRANKHRPHEASSKKPVPRLREIIPPVQRPGRDPRFAPAQTQAERDAAAKRYSFVYDDMLPQDRNRIKAQLKQTRNERARASLTSQLQRVEQSMRAEQDRRRKEKIETEWRAKQRSALEGGTKTKPFYLKKGEKKKLALVARYQELQERGQLDKYMEKRRKRNASKDHKRIPGR